MGAVEQLRDLLSPAVASEGLELWDVELSRSVVRVLIDRPGGIDLDELGAVSRDVVNPLLDDHPELTPGDAFQLEVSSPGLERNLRTPDQYRRYLGREITVKTTEPVAGGRRHHGLLDSVADSAITVAPKDGPTGATVEIPFDLIDRARTVLDWGPTPKQGGKSPSGRPAKAPKPAPTRREATPATADSSSASDSGSVVAASSAPSPEPKDPAS